MTETIIFFFKLKQNLLWPTGKRCVCIGWTHFDIHAEPPSARQQAAKAARCREERSARSDYLQCCVCTHTFRGPETENEGGGKEWGREELISNERKRREWSFSLVFPRSKLLNGNWLFGFITGEKNGPLKKAVCVCVFMRRVQVCNTESTITISLSFLRAGMPCTLDNDWRREGGSKASEEALYLFALHRATVM